MTIQFAPDVERWRSTVAKYAPANLVDKYLWIINYESGGNPNAIGDNGVAIGLTQIHSSDSIANRPTAAELLDPEYNIWYAVNHLSFGDWGEGRTYNGQVFGALGNHPFPGDGATQSGNAGTANAPGSPGVLADFPSVPGAGKLRDVTGWAFDGVSGVVRDASGKIVPDVVSDAAGNIFDRTGKAVGKIGDAAGSVGSALGKIAKAFVWLLDPHHWFRLFFVFGGVTLFFAGLYVYIRGDKAISDAATIGKVAAA